MQLDVFHSVDVPRSFSYKRAPTNLDSIDPYKLPAGPDLDAVVHRIVLQMEVNGPCPPYSTDPVEADKVRSRVKARFGTAIVSGRTRIAARPWFARYGSDPSSSTEVVAETYPLAICRLALLRAAREYRDST